MRPVGISPFVVGDVETGSSVIGCASRSLPNWDGEIVDPNRVLRRLAPLTTVSTNGLVIALCTFGREGDVVCGDGDEIFVGEVLRGHFTAVLIDGKANRALVNSVAPPNINFIIDGTIVHECPRPRSCKTRWNDSSRDRARESWGRVGEEVEVQPSSMYYKE